MRVLAIGRDREGGLGRCLEQQIVDRGLVLVGDNRRSAWQPPRGSMARATVRPRARRAIAWRRRPEGAFPHRNAMGAKAAPVNESRVLPSITATATFRDFVPWRFSDAGRKSAWIG